MPDHMLRSITPLGGDAPRRDDLDGLHIAETTGRALASIALRHGQHDPRALETALGFELPAPGLMTERETWAAFWTAPSQWMIEAPFETHEDIAGLLKDMLGDAASVTEQTDAWACFDISGPRSADLFERLCALDIRAMKDRTATRTLIDHLGCFVLCRAMARDFTVLGPRSAARSLHHAILGAAHSGI